MKSDPFALITWVTIGFTLAASIAMLDQGNWENAFTSWAFCMALVLWRWEVARHKETKRELAAKFPTFRIHRSTLPPSGRNK